jgi:peptidylprolyl isomerase
MVSKKQTYIAVALAVVVIVLFIMLGFFGVGGFGGDNSQVASSASDSQIILDELSQTGTVSQLRIVSTVEGSGEEAKAGDTITVHYIGVLPDGTVFDSSRERGTPFSFTLGVGQVIQGWDQGLLGTKVGDRMIIAIPPELGYGAQAVGGVIPANATLLFDVEVLEISR